jgi:hypothetical protein
MSGWVTVNASMVTITATLARNLASTTSISRTGAVSSSSSVPLRRSSASRRMVITGTISRSSIAA